MSDRPPAPRPPQAFRDFVARFPRLGQAWEAMREEGDAGPLDERTRRLVKLAVAVGAMREGATHSAVRKCIAAGCAREEVEQVIALAASTIGLPSSVATFTWVREVFEPAPPAG